MLTQQAFLITNEKGHFLRENTSNSTVWTEQIEQASPCLTYVEAEMVIDRINLRGFYQIQKVFLRVPDSSESIRHGSGGLRQGIDY